MIVKLKESHGRAFGFKVTETLTADDIRDISKQIDLTIAENKQPIGILADLSEMHGATWAARWEEMRFLQGHTDHIARLAIVSNDKWEEIAEMTAVAAAALQASTLYFLSSEIRHAWHWARMAVGEDAMPVRVHVPGQRPFQGLHARVQHLSVVGLKSDGAILELGRAVLVAAGEAHMP